MKALRLLAIIAILAACSVIDFVFLNEAYGAGPPYYDRSTNMDKWTSPWPVLLPLNVVGLSIVAWLILRGKRAHDVRSQAS